MRHFFAAAIIGLLTLPVSAQLPTENLDFRGIGPSNGGRVTAVAGHRDHPHTFYMGATGGGVWKTTDAGASWNPISDGFFETGSIGSIDVSDSDPAVVWVGTGSDGIRSNVIIGRGVYKSTDAGATWTHVGLRDVGQIGAIVVHPTNPEVVYVAALGSPFGPNPERGVYRTLDGGVSWTQIHKVSDKTGAVDLELNPANPDEVYAAFWTAERKPWSIVSGASTENGFYKSTDGGANWRKIEAGLPEGLTGKMDIAVSAADPSRVYLLVEAKPDEEGLYRSNDNGESFRMVSNDPGLMRRPFYYTNVDADPTNADIVWVNCEGFFKSEDGGYTFERRSTPHGDNHDMWINPDDPGIFVQSNDGGANVTLDGGRTWSSQHNQPTAELYQVDVDDRYPYWLYAGQQDNGTTIAVPSLPFMPREGGYAGFWESLGGCETGPAVPKPGNPNIIYSNCKGRFYRYSRITGQEQEYYVGGVDMYGVNPSTLPYRFQRVVPIEVSPHDPGVVYHGSQYVHKTTDEGKTWQQISPDLTAFRAERQVVSGSPITRDITGEEHYSTLYAIEESPVVAGVIWTGANDGPVHVSRDGGASWSEVTPPMPPEGRIQTIDPSPHDPATAYVAAYRTLLNDFKPYIWKTSDYGESWSLLTNGLPEDWPARVVREDPVRKGLLYAGTEFGVFVSLDDGANWLPMQGDLPVTPITDMKVVGSDLVLSTMGRGFWILDDVSWIRQWSEGDGKSQLFVPRKAIRARYSARSGGADEPEFLPPGAVIWYHLADSAEQVEIEIVDSEGSVVRRFSSREAVESAEAPDQGMRGPLGASIEGGTLEKVPGLHRFIWDLRYPAPEGSTSRFASGPMALPAAYTVRMTVDGAAHQQTLEVVMDPRVIADGTTLGDLQAQLAHNLQVRDALGELNGLIQGIESTAEKDLDEDLAEELAALKTAVITDNSDSYPPRMLNSQLQYLYGMTTSTDQPPGQDAVDRFVQLRRELDERLEQLESIKTRADR